MEQQEIDQFREQVKKLSESLQGFNESIEGSTTSLSNELGKKFPNATKPAVAALSGLGNAATDVTAAIYKGERGLGVLTKGIGTLADSLQSAIALFTLFTPYGKALSLTTKVLLNGGAALAKGMSSFQKLTAEQSDKLFTTYQDLSKIGAVGAGGLEALNDSLMRAGFSVAELGEFANALKKNAKDLTLFGATAQSGAENLASISGAITKSNLGYSLQMLGYSAADIAESTATYLNLQTRLGRVQNKTTAELAQEGAKFALELDKMARLTGISREEQEQTRKTLIEDNRYAAFLAGEARERNYDMDAVESFLGTISDPEVRKGLQHLLAGGGTATSEQARRVMLTDPQAYERMLAVAERRTSAIQASRGFAGAAEQYTKTFAGVTRYTGEGPGIAMGGAAGSVMFSERLKAMQDAADKAGMTLDEFARSEQKMAEFNKGDLKTQVDTRRAQMNINQALDSTIHSFRDLNKTTADLTSAFDSLLKKAPTPAGGPATTGGPATSTGRYGTGPGTAPTTGGPGGTQQPGGVQQPGGARPGTFGGMPSAAMLGQAITGKSLAGLDQDFANRFAAAANEFFQSTGKQVNVTSALRSYEEQAALYQEYLAGKNPYPVAPPGRSQHEIGRSVDVDKGTADMMDALGILQKYRLSRPVAGDPVHIQGYAGFRGRVSGPMNGYKVNALAHGDEEISIRPMGKTSNDNSAASEGSITELIDRVDQLITLSSRQLSVNEKILKYQH